jgi:hypothetical protein
MHILLRKMFRIHSFFPILYEKNLDGQPLLQNLLLAERVPHAVFLLPLPSPSSVLPFLPRLPQYLSNDSIEASVEESQLLAQKQAQQQLVLITPLL